MAGRGKQSRGFASMDKEKQRRIASKGGKHAHKIGRAHEWTPEEARIAGRKGGSVSRNKTKVPAPVDVPVDVDAAAAATADQSGSGR